MTPYQTERLNTARDHVETSDLAARTEPEARAYLRGVLAGIEIARAALREDDGSAVVALLDKLNA